MDQRGDVRRFVKMVNGSCGADGGAGTFQEADASGGIMDAIAAIAVSNR